MEISELRVWRQELQRWAEADKPNDYHPKDGSNLGLLLGPRDGVSVQNLLGRPSERILRKLEFRKDKTIDDLAALLLALQERDLPPQERRPAWVLADRWAREIINARLARGTI